MIQLSLMDKKFLDEILIKLFLIFCFKFYIFKFLKLKSLDSLKARGIEKSFLFEVL